MLGGFVNCDIPTGKTLQITIPPRTHAGKKVRLVGQGLCKGTTGERGDIILSVVIDIPEGDLNLSNDGETLLRNM